MWYHTFCGDVKGQLCGDGFLLLPLLQLWRFELAFSGLHSKCLAPLSHPATLLAVI